MNLPAFLSKLPRNHFLLTRTLCSLLGILSKWTLGRDWYSWSTPSKDWHRTRCNVKFIHLNITITITVTSFYQCYSSFQYFLVFSGICHKIFWNIETKVALVANKLNNLFFVTRRSDFNRYRTATIQNRSQKITLQYQGYFLTNFANESWNSILLGHIVKRYTTIWRMLFYWTFQCQVLKFHITFMYTYLIYVNAFARNFFVSLQAKALVRSLQK